MRAEESKERWNWMGEQWSILVSFGMRRTLRAARCAACMLLALLSAVRAVVPSTSVDSSTACHRHADSIRTVRGRGIGVVWRRQPRRKRRAQAERREQ